MIDIEKQITYWLDGSQEDWAVANELMTSRRIRHALFFAHLAMEKTLKALVCRKTNDLAPPTHNLVRLSQIAGVTLTENQIDLLAEVNEFNIEGRYPDTLNPCPDSQEAAHYMTRIHEILQWLTKQSRQ